MENCEAAADRFDNDRHHQRNMYFPGLKSLHLCELRLPALPSLDILSCDFPSLQHFYIHSCSGFVQLRVSNRSLEHLTISFLLDHTKIVVDAPNLVLLDFSGSVPVEISFATTSNECVTNIEPSVFNVSSEAGFRRLSKLLEEVRQSKIFLQLPHENGFVVYSDEDDDSNNESHHEEDNDNENHQDANDNHENHHEEDNDYHENQEDDNDYHENQEEANENENHEKPVPVEYLHLDDKKDGHGFIYSEAFLNRMFRYCRPRNILERECTKRSEFLCEILLLRHNNGSPSCSWQRDLEEVSMRVWDQNSQEWHSVDGTTFLESAARPPSHISKKQHQVWFKLKWRE